MKPSLGAVVRAIRTAKAIPLTAFSDQVGIDRANFSRFERNEPGGVSIKNQLEDIARGLGTTESVLYMIRDIAENRPLLENQDELILTVVNLNAYLLTYGVKLQ